MAKKCRKKGCSAYCLKDKSYCLFHQRTPTLSSKKEASPKRSSLRIPDREREAFDRLFNTDEGRALIKSEIKAQVRQKALAVPLTLGLQVVSWNNPGLFQQHVTDELFKAVFRAARKNPKLFSILGGQRLFQAASYGRIYSHRLLYDKAYFERQLGTYLSARYHARGRVKRIAIGGTARLLSRVLTGVMIADLLMTTSRLSSHAYGEALPIYASSEEERAQASWLATLAGV
jgi:hypothetical protein